MKKWIACALLGVLPAMAMAGDGRMPVTQLGPGFMSVLDADTQHARGEAVVNAWTTIYLARSENQLAQGSNVDYMAVKALKVRQWDCPRCYSHHDRDDAAANNIQSFAVERFLESLTGAESVPGNRPLHPELAAFIARGGMTAFQRGNSRECRQVQKGLGFEMPVNRGSTLTPAEPVKNRHSG